MASLIPMRPKQGRFDLKQEEMDGLSFYVLSSCPRETAFLKFVRPDFISTKNTTVVKAAVTQFFANKAVKDYIEAYKATIQELLTPPEKPKPKAPAGTLDEKKTKALTKLVEYVLAEAENIDSAEDPKAILDYANKIGLFDDANQTEERPRRYLPVTCDECAYKKFVEEECEVEGSGTILDEEKEELP